MGFIAGGITIARASAHRAPGPERFARSLLLIHSLIGDLLKPFERLRLVALHRTVARAGEREALRLERANRLPDRLRDEVGISAGAGHRQLLARQAGGPAPSGQPRRPRPGE